MTHRVGWGFAAHRMAGLTLAGLLFASAASAQPHGEERHGDGGGHGGFAHEGGGGHGFAGARAQGPQGGFAGGGYRGGGFHGGPAPERFAGHPGSGFARRDPGRFEGGERGFGPGRSGRADWAREGWHGRGPFLAYAGGRDAWESRVAWGGEWGRGGWGPEFEVGLGGWAWGGIAGGVGIGIIVAPPAYILPPPIYALPPPVVLGLPAIEPPPIVDAAPPPPPLVTAAPGTAEMVAAAVPPPIVVSPPPYVIADAPPPPVIFAPPGFAFAIAPPVLAFSVIGPAYYSGGFFTGGYIARGYDGAVWDRPYWHSSIHYARPGFIARVGMGVGLGGVFGRGGGYERRDTYYGRPGGGRPGGFARGGFARGGGGFHGGGGFNGGLRPERGGDGGHHGRERG